MEPNVAFFEAVAQLTPVLFLALVVEVWFRKTGDRSRGQLITAAALVALLGTTLFVSLYVIAFPTQNSPWHYRLTLLTLFFAWSYLVGVVIGRMAALSLPESGVSLKRPFVLWVVLAIILLPTVVVVIFLRVPN